MSDSTKQWKILIVDDDQSNRSLITLMLTNPNYHCETATNGTEALEKVKYFMPDIILLDVLMPGLDGYEVCRTLKNSSELKGIPIIIVTAMNDPRAKIMALEAGANDFLTKPIDRLELLLKTKNLFKLREEQDGFRQSKNELVVRIEELTSELTNVKQLIKTEIVEQKTPDAKKIRQDDTAVMH